MAVTHGCRPSRALGLGLSHLPRSGMLQGWFDARVQDWESGKANKGNLAWSKNEALECGGFCWSLGGVPRLSFLKLPRGNTWGFHL